MGEKIEFIPPGYDPTNEEYNPDGPSLSGCLTKIGIVLAILFAVGWVLSSTVSKAAPTPAASQATEPTQSPATQTPVLITVIPTFTAGPLGNGTIGPPPTLASPTPTSSPSATFTPTRTPTFTGTPFPTGLWVSIQPLWPKRDGNTASGVSWRAVIDRGLVCPIQWPLGATIILESGEQYLCVDRYKTAQCKDSICTALLFTQQKIDPAPRRAYISGK